MESMIDKYLDTIIALKGRTVETRGGKGGRVVFYYVRWEKLDRSQGRW